MASVAVLALAFLLVDQATFFDGYVRRDMVALAAEPKVEARDGYRTEFFAWRNLAGDPVPTILTLPLLAQDPYPCVIFLHGIGQRKEFLETITRPFNEAGFAMVCFDQYTRGERRLPRDTNWPAQVRAFRARASKTVLETRELVDYLVTRPDIDPDRLYLVGASYGAILGSTAAAFDERIAAVALVYGGGDLWELFKSSLIEEDLGVWRLPLQPVAYFLLRPADPVRYVAGIAPRPILFQNGRNDSVIPVGAAEALQDAADEPKTILWYDSDHVGLEEQNTLRVLEDVLEWLKVQDAARLRYEER